MAIQQQQKRMKQLLFLSFLLLAVFATLYTQAYPSGAPTEACETLLPQHNGTQPKTNPGIELYYTRNSDGNYTVSIDGQSTSFAPFQGFIIQARPASNPQLYETFGRFETTLEKCQPMTCRTLNDTLTHTNNFLYLLIRFKWIPPAGSVAVVFRYF